MQIGALPSYLAPAASSLPACPVASTASSAREEADRSPSTQSAGRQNEAESSPQQQRLEQLQIAELATRDREVRAHEQAHAAVGGSYAGAPSYTYSRGPDGQRYVVAGEVSIDTSAVVGDPQATLSKMEIVVRAAPAPAEPSAQDLRVAAQAQARVELAELRLSEAAEGQAERAQPSEAAEPAQQGDDPEASGQPPRSSAADLDLYRRTAESPGSAQLIDLLG